MRSRHHTDRLEESAPTLHAIPKVDPFVVPEGFFEKFPGSVAGHCAKHGPPVRVIPLWKRLVVQRAAAALLILIGSALALFLLRPHTQGDATAEWIPDEQDLMLLGWDEPGMLADLALFNGKPAHDDGLYLLTGHEALPLHLFIEDH